MNAGGCVGISAVKPNCSIFIRYKSSSIFGVPPGLVFVNSSKSGCRSSFCRSCCKSGVLGSGHGRFIGSSRKEFCASGLGWRRPRFDPGSNRGVLVSPHVASEFRSNSTSVESNVNQSGFERIYIQGQGALKVNPLVIERIKIDDSVVQEEKEEKIRIDVGINDSGVFIREEVKDRSEVKRGEPEIEKEAWKLLRSAIVNYCGNPVGTVAANDLVDKQALNYDQVFIRDFVPSALAFLLNREAEIVKNFLLHTLQLQVIHRQQKVVRPIDFFCISC